MVAHPFGQAVVRRCAQRKRQVRTQLRDGGRNKVLLVHWKFLLNGVI
jgi:hypothetical protein